MSAALSPALCALIDALAAQAAEDYLTAEATASNDPDAGRSNPVPLPSLHEAA